MCLFKKIKNKILEIKAKREFKKIEIDPKGVCMSVYCAKILFGVMKRSEVIAAYEAELYNYFLISNEITDHRMWTYDERVSTAASYLTFTSNCSNGEYIKQRILEELEEYL